MNKWKAEQEAKKKGPKGNLIISPQGWEDEDNSNYKLKSNTGNKPYSTSQRVEESLRSGGGSDYRGGDYKPSSELKSSTINM
jgi:hypothetical protein